MSLQVWFAFTETLVAAGNNSTRPRLDWLRLETWLNNNDDPSDADTLAGAVLYLRRRVCPGALADRSCAHDWGTHDLVMGRVVEAAMHSYAFEKRRSVCSSTTTSEPRRNLAMKKPQPSPFTQSNAVQPPDQIAEQIRQRAYQMYELRGREDGHDLDDWLRAESAVTRNFGA